MAIVQENGVVNIQNVALCCVAAFASPSLVCYGNVPGSFGVTLTSRPYLNLLRSFTRSFTYVKSLVCLLSSLQTHLLKSSELLTALSSYLHQRIKLCYSIRSCLSSTTTSVPRQLHPLLNTCIVSSALCYPLASQPWTSFHDALLF